MFYLVNKSKGYRHAGLSAGPCIPYVLISFHDEVHVQLEGTLHGAFCHICITPSKKSMCV